MNHTNERPILKLFICFAEIVQCLAVEKFHLTSRAHRRYKPRNTIDDLPPRKFARTQDLLTPLTILDIYIAAVPFDDVSRLVSNRACAKEEPAIRSVEPTHT